MQCCVVMCCGVVIRDVLHNMQLHVMMWCVCVFWGVVLQSVLVCCG